MRHKALLSRREPEIEGVDKVFFCDRSELCHSLGSPGSVLDQNSKSQATEALEKAEDNVQKEVQQATLDMQNFSDEEQQMIDNVFDFGDTIARDVMIPRIDMTWVPEDADYDTVLSVFREDKYTRMPVCRDSADTVVGISYDSDIRRAKEIMEGVYKSSPGFLPEKGVNVHVSSLGDSSVGIEGFGWVKGSEFLAAKWYVLENVKLAYDANGITIPFPQVDVHLDTAKGAESGQNRAQF